MPTSMPTPADLSTSGMMLVFYTAGLDFFITKFGLRIFQRQDLEIFVHILSLLFLAGVLYFKMKGFVGVTESINQGVWK